MGAFELKKGLYWCGASDPDLRIFDIIMTTEFGTTYNSYLYTGGEDVCLFETVKDKFFDEFVQTLSSLTDIRKIRYLVVNHTEPDHAGSAAKLLALNPNITIAVSYTHLIARIIISRPMY